MNTETTIYAVVWTIQHHHFEGSKFKDHYRVFTSLPEAQEHYIKLRAKEWKNKELYICSIMAVVESSDYETHPLLRGL